MDELRIAACDPGQAEDWQAVIRFAGGPCTWKDAGAYLAERMEHHDFLPWERVFAAFLGSECVGFVGLTKDSSLLGEKYTPYISFLYVYEPYRNRHIATRLVEGALDYARTIGIGRVHLYSGLTNFYEKMGFEPYARESTAEGKSFTIYARDTGA